MNEDNTEVVVQEKPAFVSRKHINVILPDDPADANRCDGCE